MTRVVCAAAVLLLASVVACNAIAKGPEIIDPAEAAKDPDFAVQGEYLGEGSLDGTAQGPLGAQVIARSQGKFEAYLLQGGLPGAGWKRGQERIRLDGQRDGDLTRLSGQDLQATIAGGKLTLEGRGGKAKAELKRVERQSPTLEAKAPDGAIVLFGEGKNDFPGSQLSPEGYLLAGQASTTKFGSGKMHLEFRLSWMPQALGQGRSNSGVYVHHCYEVQVLDAFGLEGKDNECGGLYSIKAPDVNMCLPPMVWQTYDIEYTAPKYDAGGQKVANAKLTVRHNGQTIHDNIELPKATPGGQPEGPAPRSLYFQGHGNKVLYRNVWVQEAAQ